MSNILKFPERIAYDDFIDEGFSPEIAAVGHALCELIDEIKERLDKLEEKKSGVSDD